ncbi:MAG: PstA family ABC transporter permease [Desulfovibrionaceae bacterium]
MASPARPVRHPDLLPTLWAWGASLGVVAVVAALVGFLLLRGGGSLGLPLFFGDAAPLDVLLRGEPVWDGIWPACLGTLALVVLATAMAVPLGVACGIYLASYATARVRAVLGFGVDVLAGAPSIVMGLFGFALILFLRRTVAPRANTCLLLAAACIALLVLPYLVTATRNALEGLPESLRLAGAGLGLGRWQTLAHILLPASGRGIMGGLILALGRAAEDTAVILLTGVVANAGAPRALGDKFEALPFHIYYLAAEYRSPDDLAWAFGAALVLLAMTSLLFLGAYWLHRTMERRWAGGRVM